MKTALTSSSVKTGAPASSRLNPNSCSSLMVSAPDMLSRAGWRGFVAGLWLIGLMMALPPVHLAQQQFQGVCARVKIVIAQELTLERIGFEAKLEITNNDGEDPLTDFFADLTFQNPRLSTNNVPNDASSLFFVRAPELENIDNVNGTGVIGPTKTAIIRWFIIPKISAGGTDPNGVRYNVGVNLAAKLRSNVLPEETLFAVPDYIYVKPEPQLEITYFQPRDVQGDDPFTDNVESPIPFTLGVLVKNSGYGAARSVKIDSQQPKIVENKTSLLLVAQLLGARVMDSALNNASLLVNLGDILPGQTRKGAWDMITSLSGEFVEFKASYTHASELGGEETSVIKSLQAHFIAHEVLNDQPGRDTLLDFLADTDRDENMYPDALYESEGNILPVNYLAKATIAASGGNSFQVVLDADRAGWGYLRLDDPGQAKLRIASIVRSDGKALNPHNYWTNIRYARITNQRSDYFNLLDLVDLGHYTYQVAYAPSLVDTNPPITTLHFVGEVAEVAGRYFITPETQMYFVTEDQSPVSIYYSITNSPFLPAYPFRLASPGEFPIRYYAQDDQANQETAHAAVLVVGTQAPELARLEATQQPIIETGEAVSTRPAQAEVLFQAAPSPTRVDAQIDVFAGTLGWATLAGTPSSPTRSRDATLVVAGAHVDFYRFQLDQNDWSAEQSVAQPLALTNLPNGAHTVRVLGRSRYGTYLVESNAVTANWMVDPEAPVTTIHGAPPSPTRQFNAQLEISGAGLALYRWTINEGYYRAETGVTNPLVLVNLGSTPQVVSVLGKINGLWQPTNQPTTVSWQIDPGYGWDFSNLQQVRSVTWTNIGADAKVWTWDGRNDAGVPLPPGWYTLRVTLRDQVGRFNFGTKLCQIGDLSGALSVLADANRGPKNPHGRGRWMVWQDQSTGNWQIYAADLAAANASILRLSDSPLSQENPKTDGQFVVWQARQANGNWDIWIKELAGLNPAWALTTSPGLDDINPAVEWPWVVYQSRSINDPTAPWLLRAQNLLTGQGALVSPSTQDQLRPDLQAGRVVWEDHRDVGYGEIYFKDLERGDLRRLTTNPFGQYHPAIYGPWIVWQDNRHGQVDLYGYDLRRDRELRLTDTPENETRPYLEGPWCLCEEDSLGASTANVRLIHLPSLRAVPMTRTRSMKSRPAWVAHHVVWEDTAGDQTRLLAARLPVLQAVFANQNAVAVTPGLADAALDAHGLLRLWHQQAGVLALTRYTALVPTLATETVQWLNDQPAGANFALTPGSFLWVQFPARHVLDLGSAEPAPVHLATGINALSYSRFPAGYSAFKLLRQLGLDKARGVRLLNSETGRWHVAEVKAGQVIGHDFAIPEVAVLLIDLKEEIDQWQPE